MLVGKRPADPAPLAAELAAKHLLYGGTPGTALEINTSEAAQLAGGLEQRLGFSARLPQLSRRDDRLVGGRVSSVADAPDSTYCSTISHPLCSQYASPCLS